jgi:glyoxylase-like metal-dependent hydrolase (beta-lactamase superfamily II)
VSIRRAHPRRAKLPLPGGRDGATVRVHPLLTGELHSPPGFLARPSGPLALPRTFLPGLLGRRTGWVWLPIPAFVVEHPGAGAFLIDTGMHPSIAEDPRENLGGLGARFYAARMTADQAVRPQLEARGFDADAIRTVVMTHLHSDHASGVSEFPAATFFVDGAEWEAASGGGVTKGYHHNQIDHDYDWRLLDYDAEEVGSHETFGRTLDLFGDGSVHLLSTPGHSSGHQSVLLRLAVGQALLLGDAAYTLDGLGSGALPLIVPDEHRYKRSQQELRAFLDGADDVKVVVAGHDPERWPDLEPVYE